jgi:hypothetical protein
VAAPFVIPTSEILGRLWKEEAVRVEEIFRANLDPVFVLLGDQEQFCRGAANAKIIFAVTNARPPPCRSRSKSMPCITSFLVAQALTLGMVEKTVSRLSPQIQYGVMER